jgi:class 3 adenylate cyclase
MSDITNPSVISLTDEEIKNIDSYRQKTNTAVLTIMFTDIEGFTELTEEKGEAYVHKLSKHHDEILTKTIQENNAGIVIKYIGDAVMAVFSEPTAAIEKSLLIQKRLREFNEANPDLDDIKVRIGLHMGQVVIENKIQTDLFGRHVNRASRIEGLADGKHIYISYTVFDSAKSYLLSKDDIGYVFHGNYLLKGIKKPEEIYEVYYKGITAPQAPRKGIKKKNIPWLIPIAAGALLLGAAATFFLLQMNKTEVYFKNFYAEDPYIDFKEPLALEAVEGEEGLKKSIEELSPGKHIIQYEVASVSRYYAEILVEPGKNILKADFTESHLPGIQLNYSYSEDNSEGVSKNRESEYFFFDKETLEKIPMKAVMSAQVTASPIEDTNSILFEIPFSITLNDEKIAEDTITIESPLDETSWEELEPVLIYEDENHYFYYKYHYKGKSIQFNLDSAFIEYK